MDPRLVLQALLETLCPNVYFQPPENLKLEYPCIVYNRDSADTQFAGNLPYKYDKRYELKYIDRKPDSLVPDKIARLPKCVFNRFFVVDGLNHDVFTLYFQEGTT